MKTPRAFQAIVTRYHGPGRVRGSRVKATAAAGSVTLHWDNSLQSDENHIAAAQALARKYNWPGKYYLAGLPDGTRVFVSPDDVPAFDNGEG